MLFRSTLNLDGNRITVTVPSENTKDLGIGANNIKIFAISNSVLKPDFYESSFLVTNVKAELPTSLFTNIEFTENKSEYWIWIIPILFFIGVGVYLKRRYL